MSDENTQFSAYELVLEDLKKRKAQIEATIAMLMDIMEKGEGTGISPVLPNASPFTKTEPTGIRPDSFFGLGLTEATKKYLAMTKSPQSIREITEALQKGGFTTSSRNFKNTVGSVLNRHEKNVGEIVRVQRNNWALAEWYPGLRRNAKQSRIEASNDELPQEDLPNDEEENN